MGDFRMPSLGADMESGFLREWRVKPGDQVRPGDIIAEVETQKGIIEIEVFEEGTVGELLIRLDEKVPVGALMTVIHPSTMRDRQRTPGITTKVEAGVERVMPLETRPKAVPSVHRIRASPLAKRIAQEKGIDLSLVNGTGPDGAITRADVEQLSLEQIKVPVAVEKPGGIGPAEDEKVGRIKPPSENIRMAVAAAMSKSNREVPHYYLQTRIDMSRALSWLSETNKERAVRDRLLPAVLLIKAVTKALGEVPELNAWWDGGLILKADIHIGFVVSLRNGGVIVPAIHDAGKKSLDELMESLSDLIPRARNLKLRSSELADSTITITNLGEGAVQSVFGIIYPPQVALVGFGGIAEEPWAERGMLGIRPVLTATLSADHRATDGNTGSMFLSAVKKYLEKPELLRPAS